MIRYRIDPSTTSYIGVCREPGCGARTISGTKHDALRHRTEHREVHRSLDRDTPRLDTNI